MTSRSTRCHCGFFADGTSRNTLSLFNIRHPLFSSLRSRMRRRSSFIVFVLSLTISLCARPSPAQSQEELLYSEMWTGVHVGGGVWAGLAFLANDVLRDSSGYALGARLTGALIMQAFHLELSYLFSDYSATVDGDPMDFRSNRLSVGVGLHPAFLAAIFGGRLWYVIASLYFQIGLNVDFNHITWRQSELNESWQLGLNLGAGFDVPLDSPDDGGGFWLGFQYRYDSSPSAFLPLGRDGSIDQHIFLLSLTYRNNGFLF